MKLNAFTEQSIFYGFSSILPRLLLFVLNPLFSYNFPESDLGIITLLYSSVIFIQILLTFGLETGFFYFSRSDAYKRKQIFGTAFNIILIAVFFFVVFGFIYQRNISSLLKLEANYKYIRYFILIVSCDILCTLPYAWLRINGKAKRYAVIRFSGVFVNFLLCLLFVLVLPKLCSLNSPCFLGFTYTKTIELIFIANLVGALVSLFLLSKDFIPVLFLFDVDLAKKLLIYSLPVLFTSVITTVNDVTDRFFLLYLLPANVNATSELGVYGANIKLAVLMAIFVQVFRLTAEPYFFSNSFNRGNISSHSVFLKYFILYGLIVFLFVVLYLDVFKYLVGPAAYWVGLPAIPVYLFANLFMGLFYCVSFWYKLSGKTAYGILVALAGLLTSVLLNIVFIPRFSYFACAWSHLAGYFVMFLLSWVLSSKYSTIKFDIRPVFFYLFVTLVIFFIAYFFPLHNNLWNLCKNTLILFLFLIYLEKKENIFSVLYKKGNQSVG
jgi:O-antigen/teichoic acid export membrane protein